MSSRLYATLISTAKIDIISETSKLLRQKIGYRQKLRAKLLPLINGDEKVVLDFTGVNVVSNSFADECIAKLLLEMPLSELKRRTTFRGLNPLTERSVLVALQRRYKVLFGNKE